MFSATRSVSQTSPPVSPLSSPRTTQPESSQPKVAPSHKEVSTIQQHEVNPSSLSSVQEQDRVVSVVDSSSELDQGKFPQLLVLPDPDSSLDLLPSHPSTQSSNLQGIQFHTSGLVKSLLPLAQRGDLSAQNDVGIFRACSYSLDQAIASKNPGRIEKAYDALNHQLAIFDLKMQHAPAFGVAAQARFKMQGFLGDSGAKKDLLSLGTIEAALTDAVFSGRRDLAQQAGMELFQLAQSILRKCSPPPLSLTTMSSSLSPDPDFKGSSSSQSDHKIGLSTGVLPRPLYLVGEGDFSFSSSLARSHVLPPQSKATSYDTLSDLGQKYKGRGLALNLQLIQQSGSETAHGVDATNFSGTSSPRLTNRLVFNFPHQGSTQESVMEELGIPKDQRKGLNQKQAVQEVIQRNQQLMDGFFHSAHDKVAPGGTVEVTLKPTKPYTEWDIEGLARANGWELVGKQPFQAPEEYTHVRTTTSNKTMVSDKNTPITYTFKRQDKL